MRGRPLAQKGIGCKANLVVELQDMDNEELISMVGGGQVETVVAHHHAPAEPPQ